MNGEKIVVDTNIIIYILDGNKDLSELLFQKEFENSRT
jgi:rRNA-processing protein FCF1